jgi:PTS system cellobiose-specific IIC component
MPQNIEGGCQMNINSELLKEKIQAGMGAFAENRYIKSISNGMSSMMTPIIVGSVFTMLANLPIPAYQSFIGKYGINKILSLTISATVNIMALFAVFFIAYHLAKQYQKNGPMAGMLALINFLIVTPLGELKNGDKVISYLPFDWLGAKGLFVAIIVALVTARLYILFIDHDVAIKMPDSVPPAIASSFATLIPGFATSILALIVATICKLTPFGSLSQMIYSCIQIPMEGLGGTFGALIIMDIVIGLLWFFGIHGTFIVYLGIMLPIYMSLDMQNLAAYQAGLPLPHIIGREFFMSYVIFSGTGATIGLNLLMLFKAKSKQYKILGKLAFPTSIFGINEPLAFGTPIVLNPVMLLPYLITPILCSTIAYVSTLIGLVPRLCGVQLPSPTPMIITGFMEGGWRAAALQVVLLFVSIAAYYIPFKIVDKKAYELEQADNSSQVAE